MSETIEDFINQADDYIKLAYKYKSEYLDVANAYYNLSINRLADIKSMHDIVTKVINNYRSEHGEPPAPMMAIYNYEHGKHIKKVGELKIMQDAYKNL